MNSSQKYLIRRSTFLTTRYIPKDAYAITRHIIQPVILETLGKFGQIMFLMHAVVLGGRFAKDPLFVRPQIFWQVPFLGHRVISHYRNFIIARNAVKIQNKRKYFTYRILLENFDNAEDYAISKINEKNPSVCLQMLLALFPILFILPMLLIFLLVVEEINCSHGIIHDSIGITANHIKNTQKTFKEVFIKIHETYPFVHFFERLNKKEICLSPALFNWALNNVPDFKWLGDIAVKDKESGLYLIKLNDFLDRTRGDFDLREIREAPFFIS